MAVDVWFIRCIGRMWIARTENCIQIRKAPLCPSKSQLSSWKPDTPSKSLC